MSWKRGLEVVEAVGAPARDVQEEIELGRSRPVRLSHDQLPQ